MANKEAVFSLRVDTGNSVKDVQNFDQSINKLNKDMQETQKTASQSTGTDNFSKKLDEMDKKLASGTLTFREMTKLMKEYQTVAAQTGSQSPVGDRAIKAAAQLKDTLTDLETRTKLLSSDYIALDTAVAGIQTGTAAFQGFQSVVALTGAESEQLVQTMVKLQAAQGLVNSVNQIALALNKDAILGIQVRTAWEKIYATAVGQSTGAMKLFRLALLATGIGAIIVGVGLLIANFEKLKDMLSGVSAGQKALNATVDDYKKGAQDAITSTQKVGTAFDLAKEGVISKEEALQTYNDTLGDAFGKATTLAEAEELFNKKADAYIEAMSKRAQANALFSKSAEETANALTASSKDQRTTTDSLVTSALSAFGLFASAADTQVKQQKEGAEEAKKNAKANAKIYEDEAKKLLKSAEETEKVNGIKSESEQKLEDEKKKISDKAAADAKKRREEEYKAEQDRLKNLQALYNEYLANIEAAETEYYDSLLTDQQREEQAVSDKFFNLIEQAKQHGDDTSILEAAQQKALTDIRKKFDDERLAKIAETEQKNLDLLRSYQELVLDEYQYQLIQFEDQQAEKSKKLSEALAAGLITEQQFMDAQLELEKQYAEKEKELNKAKEEAITDKKVEEINKRTEAMNNYLNASLDSLNSISDLNSLVSDLAIQQAEGDAEKQEKLRKQAFNRDKALQLGVATVQGIQAVQNAFTTGLKSPITAVNPAYPYIQAALAGAVSAANIAKIAASKYGGGGSVSAGGAAPSTAGASTGAGASTFTANTNAQQTETAGLIGGQGQQGGVTQVVVVESDITNVQNKVSAQQALSTY